MRFLVDAQLPRRICKWLREAGHDVVHTLDLPPGNATPDSVVLTIAMNEQRIVVTKDDDFVQSHLVAGRPERLLLMATGNIGNAELETLLRSNLTRIENALQASRFVEISRRGLTTHD